MKYFSRTVLASLLITTPTLNAYPNNDIPVFSIEKSFDIPDPRNLSYDEVMNLLALIESDSFEERCSIEQLNQVNQLISFLAMEGAAEDEKINLATSIANLFEKNDDQYAYWIDSNIEYVAQPAIFRDKAQNIILCKSWFKKQWDQTRKFVKEHKKEIIIGAIIVVAVTVVVVTAVLISTSAAGAAAGGLAASGGALNAESSPPYQEDNSSHLDLPRESSLTSSLQEQMSTFKENVAQQQLGGISDPNGISIEENGRIVGSLFAHKTIDTLATQAAENPFLGHELQHLGNHSCYPPPKWANGLSPSPHTAIDSAFSTNYSPTCIGNSTDLNTLTYQARGDWALSSGYYCQAVQDFGKAIANDPSNSSSYLGRGVAHFELGHYEESIADYNTYVSQAKESFSVTDFSVGFAKGLPKGIYDSGEGMLLFVTDLACHPIQTGGKVYESLSTLSGLVKSGEWSLIGETLSPELHQLISEWDSLSAREKGELSGYAFGKHGADVLIPGGAAKAAAKGGVAVKELGSICKTLQSAEKLLILEAVAEGGSAGMNVGEAIISTRKALIAGEDLGLSAKEIAGLKQSGELEQVIGKGRDFFAGNAEMQASYDLFKKAKETLEPYAKKPMPEANIRNLIHQSGVPTFKRPAGIPENYLVRITEKGAGMEYVHPTNKNLSVRIMPGKPHSPNPLQQQPYVIQTIGKKALDKNGNLVSPKSPEAHISLNEFIYSEEATYVSK